MTTEQWERENQDTLMEYFIDGDPIVRRIQLSAEPTPALAVVSSSCRFGRMPDIAATPVGRKTTASVK